MLTPVAPERLGPRRPTRSLRQRPDQRRGAARIAARHTREPAPRRGSRHACFLAKTKLPVVCTYQGRGRAANLFDCFAGRVGLFHNQPADKLLDAADVVVAVEVQPGRVRTRSLEQGTQASSVSTSMPLLRTSTRTIGRSWN